MSTTLTTSLDYVRKIQSVEEAKRRNYLDLLGFHFDEENPIRYLDKELGTGPSAYNFPESKPTKENVKVVFGLGNGECPIGKVQHKVKKWVVSNNPSLVEFDDSDLKQYQHRESGYLEGQGLEKIIPIRLVSVDEGLTPEYKVFNPASYSNRWFRKYFTKECSVQVIDSSGEEGLQSFVRISCLITKKDLNFKPMVGIDSFSELCIYSGTQVRFIEKTRNYPIAYVNSVRPKEDLLNVVPIFSVSFDPIRVEDIPEYGLKFVFEIDMSKNVIVEPDLSDPEIVSPPEDEEENPSTPEPDPSEDNKEEPEPGNDQEGGEGEQHEETPTNPTNPDPDPEEGTENPPPSENEDNESTQEDPQEPEEGEQQTQDPPVTEPSTEEGDPENDDGDSDPVSGNAGDIDPPAPEGEVEDTEPEKKEEDETAGGEEPEE